MIVLIWSDEHRAYWMPEGCGYTEDRDLAGRWYLERAKDMTRGCGPEKKIKFIAARRQNIKKVKP